LFHIIRQIPAQTLEPAILVEQDNILDDALIPAAGPMLGERRGSLQTIQAKMGLCSPLKKLAAAQAIGVLRTRLDLFLTTQADKLFPRFLEEGLTDFAK